MKSHINDPGLRNSRSLDTPDNSHKTSHQGELKNQQQLRNRELLLLDPVHPSEKGSGAGSSAERVAEERQRQHQQQLPAHAERTPRAFRSRMACLSDSVKPASFTLNRADSK
jgi:hypothetical protein